MLAALAEFAAADLYGVALCRSAWRDGTVAERQVAWTRTVLGDETTACDVLAHTRVRPAGLAEVIVGPVTDPHKLTTAGSL